VHTRSLLASFDAQLRRRPERESADVAIERNDRVIRVISRTGSWTGVSWSNLDPGNVDAVIAAQINRFVEIARPWEWKVYSYDQPADLGDRLIAAGFIPGPVESVMVAEIASLRFPARPAGLEVRPVADQHGVDTLVRLHDQVFGGDHSAVGAAVLDALPRQPRPVAAVIAWSEGAPIASGRVEFHDGSDFASLWGGGTLPGWRGRGAFRSLVAHRAALAAARGFRYLLVDASAASRPILRRLGFVELATTTPYLHPGS
jgi:hypothetical protein